MINIAVEISRTIEVAVSVNGTGTGVCDDVTIVDQDSNVIDTVEPGGQYQVIVFSGILDDGSGVYSNSIVDNT